jgi:7-cyano-7-deazaguanine synthase
MFNVKDHRIVNLSIGELGGSALTDSNLAIPDYKEDSGIPITYVPARNTVFLSIALGFAEVVDAHDIFIGVSSVDYSGYPDCRPEFIDAFQKLSNVATVAGINGNSFRIQAPLMYLDKAQTIKKGIDSGVDYSMTVTCYRADADGRACGSCDSCTLRKKGFLLAGVNDPTRYV